MKGFFATGKISACVFCFGLFVCSPFSYGAPPQQPPEQPAALEKHEPASISSSTSPAVKIPGKYEKKKAPKVGIKQAHPGTSDGKGLAKPKHLKPQHQNPVDLFTGQELLPMPVETKH
jgi:hypothetical protein